MVGNLCSLFRLQSKESNSLSRSGRTQGTKPSTKPPQSLSDRMSFKLRMASAIRSLKEELPNPQKL